MVYRAGMTMRCDRSLPDCNKGEQHEDPAASAEARSDAPQKLSFARKAGTAAATAQGPHTELVVRLDLREGAPGAYFLGTQRLDDDAPYFYPVMLN